MKRYLLTFFLLASSCKNKKTEIQPAQEILKNAKIEKDTEKAKKAYLDIEHYYPNTPEAIEAMYKRGCLFFEKKDYAQAAGIFDAFLEFFSDSEFADDVRKKIFLCYYSQITSYNTNIQIIYRAILEGQNLKKIGLSDSHLEIALKNLFEFVDLHHLQIIYFALESDPKLWIQILYTSKALSEDFNETKYASEALFRMFEFFINQNNEKTFEIALKIYEEMKKIDSDSFWNEKALKLIKNYKK